MIVPHQQSPPKYPTALKRTDRQHGHEQPLKLPPRRRPGWTDFPLRHANPHGNTHANFNPHPLSDCDSDAPLIPRGVFTDPPNDCKGYITGEKKDCPSGKDIGGSLKVEANTLIAAISLGGDPTQPVSSTLAIRFKTPPGTGQTVSDHATYQGVEHGNRIVFTHTPGSCRKNPGTVNLPGARCANSNNGHRIDLRIPISELGPFLDPLTFRIFTTLHTVSGDIPVDPIPDPPLVFKVLPLGIIVASPP